MTYDESIKNCLDVASEYGLDSEQYREAQHEMLVAGRRAMKSRSKSERFINFLYKIQWLLKRKKY